MYTEVNSVPNMSVKGIEKILMPVINKQIACTLNTEDDNDSITAISSSTQTSIFSED